MLSLFLMNTILFKKLDINLLIFLFFSLYTIGRVRDNCLDGGQDVKDKVFIYVNG